MVCGQALLQGLVPFQSGEQGRSRANPRAGHSWEWSWSSLPPNPAEPVGPYSPKLTLIPSFLCEQLNKLFSDKQVQVWVQ